MTNVVKMPHFCLLCNAVVFFFILVFWQCSIINFPFYFLQKDMEVFNLHIKAAVVAKSLPMMG